VPRAPEVQPELLRRRRPTWVAVLILVIAIALTPTLGFVGIVAFALFASFPKPNVDPIVTHVRSMSCVQWTRGFSDGGSVDNAPTAIFQVGLSAHCTATAIAATYAYINYSATSLQNTPTVTADYFISSAPPKHEPADAYTQVRSPGAQLTMETTPDLPTTAQFSELVDDWITVRRMIDPRAQIQSSLTDLWAPQPERITVNTTAEKLRSLTTTLSPRLQSMAWKVTIPAGSRGAFVEEGTAPPGGVTIETTSGLPDPWLVDLGEGLNGAWPAASSTGEYVYLYREAPPAPGKGFNEVSARVFGVTASQAFSTTAAGRGPSDPASTSAWPALTATIDQLDAEHQTFSLGLTLYRRSFRQTDEHPYSGSSITLDGSSAVLATDSCTLTYPSHRSPDNDVIESSLYGYWLSATRIRVPGSVASYSCPDGLEGREGYELK
jgi:hypothetical protein